MLSRRFDYPIDPYDSTLTVLVVDSFVDISAKCRALGLDDEDEEDFSMCRGICWELHFVKPPRPGASVGRWVVAVQRRTPVDIVAHEAVHAALNILKFHELPISPDPELQEPIAYQAGWVVRQVLDAQKRALALDKRRRA